MKLYKACRLNQLFVMTKRCTVAHALPRYTMFSSSPAACTCSVVSGASRGIGLEFTRQLLSTPENSVIALSRRSTPALETLKREHGEKLQIIPTDLENQASIDDTVYQIKQKYKKIDLLLNVAGILGDSKNTPGPERKIADIERSWLEKSFQVKFWCFLSYLNFIFAFICHRLMSLVM